MILLAKGNREEVKAMLFKHKVNYTSVHEIAPGEFSNYCKIMGVSAKCKLSRLMTKTQLFGPEGLMPGAVLMSMPEGKDSV